MPFNTTTKELSLIGLGLQLVATGNGKPIELERCPKCQCPIAHYRDDKNWSKKETYWHIGSKQYPCNKTSDF